MTFSHDDIRDRLVDYLYGELDGDVRAAFLAHLDGCQSCREEVAGAEKARALARTVVRAPLGDAVPDRVRARMLEAALAAAAKASTAPAGAERLRAASEGWFSRLRRRWTWTFPTFATVAAMAVFLLVRATIFREAKRPLSETPTGALETAPAPAVTAAPAAAPAPIEPNAVEAPAAPAEPSAGKPQVFKRKAVARGGHGAVGASAGPNRADGPAGADQPSPKVARPGLGGLSTPDGFTGGSAEQAEKKRSGGDDDRAAAKEFEEQPREPKNASRTARLKAPASEAPASAAPPAVRSRPYAPPPPPAPAAVAAAHSPAKSDLDDRAFDGVLRGKRAPSRDMDETEMRDDAAPARSSAPAARKEAKKEAPKGNVNTKDKAPLAAPVAPPDTAGEGAAPADSVVALASRAEGLMSAHRWADAAALYRDLLRRFPQHPAAPTWRKRLATAQAALAADTGQFATPPPPGP